MKNLKTQLAVLVLSTVSLLTGAFGQLTPTGDSYTSTATPTKNFGSATTLGVESSQTTFIQFNLSSIPSAYTSADITKATLKLFVDGVTTAGSFNVDYVNGTWTESTIDASNAPALGTTIAASVPLVTADKNQYILVDVTAAVQAWLSGTPNDGIALVANSPLSATFDSKEATKTSHTAELDIVFAGGGTLTGVTTASGSGLTGGGTSGTLNLSLSNACAANQVLQWNGTSWTCAAVGTGTVTSVGSGTGLTGGPITGSGTLSINAAVVPLLAAANVFTGNQTVNGNLSATGVVAGSGFLIGSNLFDYGSYANFNSFVGFAGNTTMTGVQNFASGFQALLYNTTGVENTATGVSALVSNTTGQANTAVGDSALMSNTTGIFNTAVGSSALADSSGSSNTAVGLSALQNNTTGSYNSAVGELAGFAADGSSVTGSNDNFLGYYSQLSTGTFNNATAIGAYAEVSASNAMVLGSFAASPICQLYGCANTNVGIGTTNPGAPLEVDGSNQLVVFLKAPANGVGAGLDFFTTGPKGAGLQWEMLDTGSAAAQGPNKLNIRNVNAGTDVLTILASGNVGIGTTEADNLLTVNGSADKPGGGSWGTYSDGRLKNLNGSFNSGLSQVLKLNPVRYRYKAGNALGIRDRDEHIGVVAQDVQRVIPEAVTENSKGYLLVNNDPIIWSMLNAIKEQQKEIRALKSELRATRQSLQKVQAQVAGTRPALVAAK